MRSNNYHYNKNNQKRTDNFYNKRTTTNNNINYTKAQEENRKLKMELNQKKNILKDYNARIEILKEELHQLQKQKTNQNRINNNNNTNNNRINNNNNAFRNRGKSNTNNRISINNNFGYYDPFDDIINNGLANFIFEDVIPNRNVQRINPNFNPGDYEDYYQNNNINNLLPDTHMNNFGNYNDESKVEQDIIDQLYPDPDKMTYEQLLELEENVGNVSKGLTKKQIKKIPKVVYNRTKFKNDDNKCVVCQYEFKNGEEVTKLTCGHLFHSECVDTWLSKNKVCPMCHKEIIIK